MGRTVAPPSQEEQSGHGRAPWRNEVGAPTTTHGAISSDRKTFIIYAENCRTTYSDFTKRCPAATSASIFILNEVFNSTSLEEAVFLSTRGIIELDAICVCVTFMDELVSLSNTTVSMASNVKPDDIAERTFKVTRRPPDGLAYAISVAEKYRLTYKQLRERLAP